MKPITKNTLLFFGFVALCVLSILGWYLGLRPIIVEWLSNSPFTAQAWWQKSILQAFPRLEVELIRLGPDFFVSKADQLVFRALGLGFAALVIFQNQQKIRSWLFQGRDVANIFDWLMMGLVAFGLVWFGYDIWTDLWLRIPMRNWYKPLVLVSRVPGLDHAPGATKIISFIALQVIMLTFWIGWGSVWAARVLFVTWIYSQAWLYGFGKIDHTYATLNWVFWLFLWNKDRQQLSRFVLAAIGVTYFLAGLEKLLTSGPEWIMDAGAFFKNYGTDLGKAFGSQSALSLLVVVAWLGQLLTPFMVFKRHYWGYWVLWAILFHWGTWVFLGAGAWVHPWFWAIGLVIYYHQGVAIIIAKRSLDEIEN